jgi:hypothetical protein
MKNESNRCWCLKHVGSQFSLVGREVLIERGEVPDALCLLCTFVIKSIWCSEHRTSLLRGQHCYCPPCSCEWCMPAQKHVRVSSPEYEAWGWAAATVLRAAIYQNEP